MVLFTIGLVGFCMMMVVEHTERRIDWLRLAYGLRLEPGECLYDVQWDDDMESTLRKGKISNDPTVPMVVWCGGAL